MYTLSSHHRLTLIICLQNYEKYPKKERNLRLFPTKCIKLAYCYFPKQHFILKFLWNTVFHL